MQHKKELDIGRLIIIYELFWLKSD